MIRKCKECGRDFVTYPSRCRGDNGRFCSVKCRKITTARKNSVDLTQERIREILNYDKKTGFLYWGIAPKHRSGDIKVGDRAGYEHHKGYRLITIDGNEYFEHRVIWLMQHGKWPKKYIDHINRVKDDNRLENLREAEHGQNRANSKGNSKRGLPKGVNIFGKRFAAYIKHNGKTRYIGMFSTARQAHKAYMKEAKKLHREFANAGHD